VNEQQQPGGQTRQGAASVLVVEDNPDLAGLLQAALEDEDCLVHVAYTGEQALHSIQEAPPDALTLDLMLMGELSGQDVLRQLRQRSEAHKIPVVLVSAHAHELDPELAHLVAHVVGKPFYLSEVVDAVLVVLGRAHRTASD
jgi:DNA-binding response OmpR family regulator